MATSNMVHSSTALFRRGASRLCFESYSIWLFTRSDLKTIVIPKSLFGILGALSGSSLVTNSSASVAEVLARGPLVVIWVWIVLLPFNIDNQRRREAIEEDRLNRPWRPLPSKRMSPTQAFRLMLVFHLAAVAYSAVVGGLWQSLTGVFLGWIYNGLGGADRSCIAKNFVNALGYVTFSMGALSVATGSPFTPCGLRWFALIGAVVFSTVQMQDLPDIEGDALRARRTVPLVLGTRACRWTIAVLVPFWTAAAASFWGLPAPTALPSGLLAAAVSRRVLGKTTQADDEVTFRLWNLWIVLLYAMPLTTRSGPAVPVA